MDILNQLKEYLENNQLEEVVCLMQKGERDLEYNDEFWLIKGLLFFKIQEYEDAIKCFQKAIDIKPNNVDAVYNLGYCQEIMGNKVKALHYYNEILKNTEDINLIEEINKHVEVLHKEVKSYEEEIIIQHTEKLEAPRLCDDLYDSRSQVAKILGGADAPLISISILAYNRIDKTRKCVDSVLKYVQGYDYELILVDNGSTDGTLDYFKSIKHPRKKIIHITKNLGHTYGMHQCIRYMRGQYVTILANDTYVTKGWIENILKCVLSDKRIGVACALSDNVSNLQSIDLGFNSFEEMQIKAEAFNKSDPNKWHEYIRLFAFGGIWRREVFDIVGSMDYGFFFDFSDDDWSLRIRRAGYKMILCKDTYVRHDHENARDDAKDKEHQQESLEKGWNDFKEKNYGLDAWGDILNNEIEMVKLISKPDSVFISPSILGVDVMCGLPILQVKNQLRELGIYTDNIFGFTSDAKYYLDLRTICSQGVVCGDIESINIFFNKSKFEYIILGQAINTYPNFKIVLDNLLLLLEDKGHLLLKVRNTKDILSFCDVLGITRPNIEETTYWEVSIETIKSMIEDKGYYIEQIKAEQWQVGQSTIDIIDEVFNSSNNANNEVKNSLLLKYYLLDIRKNKFI